jgi:hypothetical protein
LFPVPLDAGEVTLEVGAGDEIYRAPIEWSGLPPDVRQ